MNIIKLWIHLEEVIESYWKTGIRIKFQKLTSIKISAQYNICVIWLGFLANYNWARFKLTFHRLRNLSRGSIKVSKTPCIPRYSPSKTKSTTFLDGRTYYNLWASGLKPVQQTSLPQSSSPWQTLAAASLRLVRVCRHCWVSRSTGCICQWS